MSREAATINTRRLKVTSFSQVRDLWRRSFYSTSFDTELKCLPSGSEVKSVLRRRVARCGPSLLVARDLSTTQRAARPSTHRHPRSPGDQSRLRRSLHSHRPRSSPRPRVSRPCTRESSLKNLDRKSVV